MLFLSTIVYVCVYTHTYTIVLHRLSYPGSSAQNVRIFILNKIVLYKFLNTAVPV